MRDSLEHWRDQLSEVGQYGTALCGAIEGDDTIAAIAAAVQLRRARAALARLEAPARLRGSAEELAVLDEVSDLTIAARAAEAVMARWHARPLPPERQLLASPLGTAVLAESLLPAVWDFETDLVVLAGPGHHALVDVLRSLGQQRLIVVADPLPTIDGCLVVASGDEMMRAMRTMVPGAPARAIVHGGPGCDLVAMEELSGQVHATLSDLRIHRNTICVFSRTWIAQATTNLPSLGHWPSVDAVGNRFAGVPMVIVAPGPSLANNVDQLRALKGRAILCAFSHSLKPVLAAGLVPDLVLTVDPQDVRYHFEGCDVSRSTLVSAATAHPSLFELPAPRHLTLSANCAIDDWIFDALDEDAVVPGGGSVATTAFSLALRWQCDPIIFVGLDLSFPGGKYYVSTSSDGGARAELDEAGHVKVAGWSQGFHAMKAGGGPPALAERAIHLPGWAGGTVPSSFMFGMFHRWFTEQLATLAETSDRPTVYNCTEGGAYIPGMRHVPLAIALGTLDRVHPVTETLDSVVAATDRDGRTAQLGAHFQHYVRQLGACRRLASRGRDLIASGLTGESLVATERQLADALRPLVFVSLVAQREVERAADAARRAGTEQDFLSESDRVFEAVIRVVDELRPQLEAAVGRLGGSRHARSA